MWKAEATRLWKGQRPLRGHGRKSWMRRTKNFDRQDLIFVRRASNFTQADWCVQEKGARTVWSDRETWRAIALQCMTMLYIMSYDRRIYIYIYIVYILNIHIFLNICFWFQYSSNTTSFKVFSGWIWLEGQCRNCLLHSPSPWSNFTCHSHGIGNISSN